MLMGVNVHHDGLKLVGSLELAEYSSLCENQKLILILTIQLNASTYN